MTFGERLRQLRKESGMSMEEVAEKVGLTRPTIFRYENGTIKSIPPDKVHALANLFGVTRPYLMGWTEEPNINPFKNLDTVADKLRENRGYANLKWKPASESDCITAATQALRALVRFRISRTPIYPQQIMQASPLATMATFDGIAEADEEDLYPIVKHGEMTRKDGSQHYIFYVDRNAPIGHLSLSLAVALGHIYLGHDENHLDDAMEREAECFAAHMMFPRPVIRLLEERKYAFTEESFARIFGYCDWCIDSLQAAPKVTVSAELNRLVKDQFRPYVDTLEEMNVLKPIARNRPLDLSRYMDGYED